MDVGIGNLEKFYFELLETSTLRHEWALWDRYLTWQLLLLSSSKNYEILKSF